MNPQLIRRIQLILASVFVAIAALLLFWHRNLPAMLALFVGMGLSRSAKSQPAVIASAVDVSVVKAPKPVRWYVGAILLALMAASHWLLDYAEVHHILGVLP